MRKVAIITLSGYFNYGNRLQNYALQETLKSLKCDVDTIKNNTKNVSANQNRKRGILERLSNKSSKLIFQIMLSKVNDYYNREIIKERTKIFGQFTTSYIKETDFMILDKSIAENISKEYDYFVTGSDQVWNPDYLFGTSTNFLTFAPSHKRIAYAASFGVSVIGENHTESYKKWISEVNKLSVREDDGAKIIKTLTGRDAPVHIDPTLLLTREKWLSVAKEAKNKPKKEYLLTYFLGGIPKRYKEQIKDISKKNNLGVINLGDIKEKDTYATGPSEFIDYINSCSIFYTDSFHGCVFAILLGKPFVVCERQGTSLSMFSRINTLLDKFDLNSRMVENIKTNEHIFNIDYSHVPPILETERAKALDYLKEALNIKNEG